MCSKAISTIYPILRVFVFMYIEQNSISGTLEEPSTSLGDTSTVVSGGRAASVLSPLELAVPFRFDDEMTVHPFWKNVLRFLQFSFAR